MYASFMQSIVYIAYINRAKQQVNTLFVCHEIFAPRKLHSTPKIRPAWKVAQGLE